MEIISLNELCRRLNWSTTKVRQAIDNGIIKPSSIHKTPGKVQKYYWPAAKNDFTAAYSIPETRVNVMKFQDAKKKKDGRGRPKKEKLPQPEPENNEDEEQEEEINFSRKRHYTEDHKGQNEPLNALSEAEKRRTIANAELAEVKLKKELGKLVDVSEVRKILYAYGQEVKTHIMAVPENCVDDLLAAESRREAMVIMQTALNKALKVLSEIDTRKLSKDEEPGI